MNNSLWVFGYGSLCWNPGFEFDQAITGFIQGFSRKFWQGNTTHRGIEGKPGRVATIVEDTGGLVWGKAFRLSGEAALPYLDKRECFLGGYKTQLTTFRPRVNSKEDPGITVLVYVANPGNRLWLGDAPLHQIADQIVNCRGASGHNVEYLLRLATFMRENIPEAEDPDLYMLEFLVMSRIKEKNLPMKQLMGESDEPIPLPVPPVVPPQEDGAVEPRVDTFQFISRVPPKKLRCLNI